MIHETTLSKDKIAEELESRTQCPWMYPSDASSELSKEAIGGVGPVDDLNDAGYSMGKFITRSLCDTALLKSIADKGDRAFVSGVFLKNGTFFEVQTSEFAVFGLQFVTKSMLDVLSMMQSLWSDAGIREQVFQSIF